MIRDSYISDLILEELSDIDKERNILGKLKGKYGHIGASRNGRIYSEKLWSKVLNSKEIKDRLANRTMIGCLGHSTKLDDNNLHNSAFVVTKLYRQGNDIIGEADILDTEPGKLLKTLLKSGIKLDISSRAYGTLSKEKQNGLPLVNDSDYQLLQFDTVLIGGIEGASPKLVETLNEGLAKINLTMDDITESFDSHFDNKSTSNSHNKEKGENAMADNMDLQAVIIEATKKSTLLEKEVESVKKENEVVKNEIENLKAENESLKEQIGNSESNDETLKKYKELGSIEEISEVLEVAEKVIEIKEELESFKALGSVEELEQVIESSDKIADKVIKFEEEVGTFKEVEETITKAAEKVSDYMNLGSIEEIEETCNLTEALADKIHKDKQEKLIEGLSDELGVSKSAVETLISKGMSEEEVKNFLSDFVEKEITKKKYTKKSKNENEEDGEKVFKPKARKMSLTEQFTPKFEK